MTPYFIKEAVDFSRVMLPRLKDPENTILWHVANLGVVADRPHDLLQGLALFRFVETPEQGKQDWLHIEGAKGLWVDATASLAAGGIGRMIQSIYKNLNKPEWVGFARFKHNDRMSVYPASFFDRLLKAGI